VSYYRALDTNATSDALFRDRVVFIGARLLTKFADERKDEFRSPYAYRSSDLSFMPGVDLQATMFLNLVRGDWLRRWTDATERKVLVIFGLAIGAMLVLMRPSSASVVALGALLGIGATTYLGFTRRQFWFPWLIPAAMTVAALGWAVVFNSIRLFIQKMRLEQSLALHLSPSRARQLMSRPELLRPGAEKQLLSILFSDIADFTKISEGMDSDDLAQMMNRYFDSAISAVHDSDGTVVKLIGDAIFAIWNAPLPQADHGARMCRAALKLRDQPVSFVVGDKERVLFTRIGLHTGEANVGNFGSATRFDYTALGENINLASRMEGLNKHLGTQVLMTGATHALVAAHFVTRHAGSFQLKGFEKPVEVYELLSPLEQAEESREWREVFAQALKCYRDLDHTTAKMLFHQVLHLRPEDGPSKFYLGRISEIESEKMVAEWGGHTRMFDK
jgi:adenylate cyclase